MQVHSGHDFWKWVRKTVVPITYNEWYYNEKPTSRRMRRYLTDMASFRVGAVQMRQLRVKPGAFSGHSSVSVCFLEMPSLGVMQKVFQHVAVLRAFQSNLYSLFWRNSSLSVDNCVHVAFVFHTSCFSRCQGLLMYPCFTMVLLLLNREFFLGNVY